MLDLNRNSRKLILLQRNELLSNYQKFLRKRFGRFFFTNYLINYFQKKNLNVLTRKLFKKEFQTLENFLPPNLKNVLDIGCGLGIINIFLNQKYKNELDFYLLDKDRVDNSIKYGFNENYESYNDLNETKILLTANGVNKEKIFIYDVDHKININSKIDLVISLKSMGYHYPLENYFDLLQRVSTNETEFIFDVTDGRYDSDTIKKYFLNFKVIYEEKSLHPLKRLHCSGFKLI